MIFRILVDLNIIIIIIIIKGEFFTPILTGGFSLITKWQQVSSSFHQIVCWT